MKLSNVTAPQILVACSALLTVLYFAQPVMEAYDSSSSLADVMEDHNIPAEKMAPADSRAIKDNARLLDASLQLAAVNEWCRVAFSDLSKHSPLGAKRDDLQNCLWARYVSDQAVQGNKALNRAQWEQKAGLDARAADSQLIAAWQYPRTVSPAP
ncbi:hypothetical protein [Pantoea vagans]|uniref:hypothetical protein n=1 Tax=Pantoea vagans TaxID=470934 RepID=UPI000660F356|nr:hypothetical protein [Pantoea vagans]